jgi:hypothetical protein
MFVDMLAEMRAYGEGFIIADQVPSQLAPQVVKNTSLKIIHRLAAPDDRSLCGSCAGLTEPQAKSLSNLSTGEAVVHDDRIGEAVRLRVPKAKLPFTGTQPLGNTVSHDRAFVVLSLHKNAACRSCAAPCEYYSPLRDSRVIAGRAAELDPLLYAVYFGNWDQAWTEWKNWKSKSVPSVVNIFGNDAERIRGALYCRASQTAHQWIGLTMLARSGEEAQLTPADRLMREEAALACGDLVRRLIDAEDGADGAPGPFEAARAAMLRAIAAQPPNEYPGCASCPSRCLMLPFVGPKLDVLKVQLTAASMADSGRAIVTLERMYKQFAHDTPVRFGPKATARRDWMYCVATSIETEQQRGILDQLLQDPSASDRPNTVR